MNQTPAQLRNAAAKRLTARRRFREALDVLNEAIRSDPRYAESYDNRASVFDAMGMHPQAEADRRKVEELGGLRRSAPESEATSAPPVKRKRPPQLQVRFPAAAPKRRGSTAAPAMRAIGTILVTIGLFVAAGIGIYIALTTLSDAVNGGDGKAVVAASPTPDASGNVPGGSTGTGTPTSSPTPLPESVDAALSGSPLSFTAVRSAWEGRGLTVAVGAASSEVTGFATTAIDVTLSKGGSTIKVAVLFYDSSEQLAGDWSVGASVTPKKGHTPDGPSPWANRNGIVVMLADDNTLHADARDAFLSIP